jgi:hypothetical protein
MIVMNRMKSTSFFIDGNQEQVHYRFQRREELTAQAGHRHSVQEEEEIYIQAVGYTRDVQKEEPPFHLQYRNHHQQEAGSLQLYPRAIHHQ